MLEANVMLNLYQEILMDHYRNPRHQGTIEQCDFRSERRNSSCGDEVMFTGIMCGDSLQRIAFSGKGCVISQAAASILSEYAATNSLEAILALDQDALVAMLKIPLGPVRLLCALLALEALQAGIIEYKGRMH